MNGLREKIEKFSKGEFLYELPFLEVSEKQIQITVEAGQIYSGSFTIANSLHRKMKGIVYSSNKLLQVKEQTFYGVENAIQYYFQATNLSAGEIIDGTFTIVSDCGEKEMPFHVVVEPKGIITSIGKINDLFQFAGLAKLDWSEAKRIFKHPRFEAIFLNDSEHNRMLYEGVNKSKQVGQAMEEFLIAIHKKLPIRISVNHEELEYKIREESFQDKLILTKSGWGHLKLEVSTDVNFIKLEQKTIWSDNFLGNQFTLSFLIDHSVCGYGNSFGHIYIKTIYQTIKIPVTGIHSKKKSIEQEKIKHQRKLEAEFVKNYVLFRANQKKIAHFMIDERRVLDALQSIEHKRIYELWDVQLNLIGGKSQRAKKQLEDLLVIKEELKKEAPILYQGLLYLKVLAGKEEETIAIAKNSIQQYRLTSPEDWRYTWLLLNLSNLTEYSSRARLTDLKEQYELGCHNPLLYFEAVKLYLEDASLLMELTEFELQVMQFATKYSCMNKELAIQVAYLATKEKTFNQLLYSVLKGWYEVYPEKELLTAICGLLIKGNKTQTKYFIWYKQAVIEQIGITELYEYYMYSFDESQDELIDPAVLLYFSYQSKLSNQKKAFLYAYIWKHKVELESFVHSYKEQMKDFVKQMLYADNISQNLAILYENLICEELLEEEPYSKLTMLMYSKLLTIRQDNIKGVFVYHKELKGAEYFPIENKRAYPAIISEGNVLVFADDEGNCFIDTIEYTIDSLFTNIDYVKSLVEKNMLNNRIMINQMERVMDYQVFNDATITFRRQILELEGLQKKYENSIYMSLVEYYYDANLSDELSGMLAIRDRFVLSNEAKNRIVELLIQQGMFDEAIKLLDDIPYDKLPVHTLLRLCSKYFLRTIVAEEDSTLLSLCYYCFVKGKYDESILSYLNIYYYGTTKDLFLLWRASKDFDLDTKELEERLISQMLFSESYVKDSFEVFNSYYHNINQSILIRAFLSYFGFKYLHNDRVIRTELFDIMKRELNYEDNDIYRLAILKYYSTRDKLNAQEKTTVELNLKIMISKQMLLPFFVKFKKFICLPDKLLDRYFVEYHADPSKKIFIHYRIEKENQDDGFLREQMKNICIGIYVKDFIMFYGEVIQYYITEESEQGEVITESYNIKIDRQVTETEEGDYPQLNLILASREVGDDETLLELITQYGEKRYLYEQCFQTI